MLSAWVMLALTTNPNLEEAKRLISAFQQERALVELERAAARSASEPAVLAQVYLYRGVAYGGLVDGIKAVESFRAALAFDPEVVLPEVSERVAAWFDESRRLAGLPPRIPPGPPAVVAPSPAVLPPAVEPPRALPGAVQPAPRSRWKLYLGGALLGAAAIVAGTGAWAGADSRRLNQQWQLEPGVGASQQLQQQAEGRATLANMLFGVSGALAIGGGVVFVLEL